MSFWRFCDPCSPDSDPIPGSCLKTWRSAFNLPCSDGRPANPTCTSRIALACGAFGHTGNTPCSCSNPKPSSAWHRRGFRLFWRSKSRCRSGRPSRDWQKTRSNRKISRPLSAVRIGSHSIRGAEFGFAGLAMDHGELMTEGLEVGLNCAAAVAILAPVGKTSTQGHHVAAVARAFWPRRSSNRRWLVHEIVQQPVMLFRPKSANVLEMPDFIGCLQFFAF